MRSLTGLSDDNLVGHSGAALIVGCTLVRSLVSLSLLLADVNDQSSWAGLHQDFGVFLYIKVGPVSCPWKARYNKNNSYHFIFWPITNVPVCWNHQDTTVSAQSDRSGITDFAAGSVSDSDPFDSEAGGQHEPFLICAVRCASPWQQLLWWYFHTAPC